MNKIILFVVVFLSPLFISARRNVVKIAPVVNVGTTSVVIAPARPSRKGFIIFNNSANSVYVGLAPTTVAAECTRLIPTYASWEMLNDHYYEGPISAIRNSGTGQVTVWEFK